MSQGRERNKLPLGDYRRLLAFVRPHRALFLLALVSMAVLAAATGLYAYLVGPLLRFVFTGGQGDILPLNLTPYSPDPALFPGLIVLLALVKGVAFFGQSQSMAILGQRVLADIRCRMYERLLVMPLDDLSQERSGALISRFVHDVSLVERGVTEALASLLRDSLQILVLAALAIALDPFLSLMSLLVLPVSVGLILKFGRRLRRTSRQTQESVADISNILHETLAAMKVVRAYQLEEQQRASFKRRLSSWMRAALKNAQTRSISSPTMELLGAVGLAITIGYSASRVSQGELGADHVISFFAAILMLYNPIKGLGRVNDTVQAALAASARLAPLLEGATEVTEGVRELPPLKGEVVFEDMHFAYNGQRVLQGVDLTIRPGEVMALVGASGAGKSTLASLLLRLRDPSRGRVLLDGVDIREVTLSSLRRQIALVTQEPVLFAGTLAENIACARPGASRAEVQAAAEAARVMVFASCLDAGLDTPVGEGGANLSGGERQRVCIARALIRQAPIIILDEATSALDGENERLLQEALQSLLHGRTTIIIAHRLSSLSPAGRVAVLEGGRVVETGGREELWGQDSLFRRTHEGPR